MNIDRENYKAKLNCNDEQLNELISIYNDFVLSGLGGGGTFDDLVNGIIWAMKPDESDMKWAIDVCNEIDKGAGGK